MERFEKRFSAEKRRTQLLKIAVGLFCQRGFEGTTTKAIAAAAGVSEGIIFQHFATKEQLYANILDYKAKEAGVEEWEEQLREHAEREDDEALVLCMVEGILQSDRRDPQFLRLMFQAALKGNSLPKIMAQRILPLHQFLCGYIAKRQAKGVLSEMRSGSGCARHREHAQLLRARKTPNRRGCSQAAGARNGREFYAAHPGRIACQGRFSAEQ